MHFSISHCNPAHPWSATLGILSLARFGVFSVQNIPTNYWTESWTPVASFEAWRFLGQSSPLVVPSKGNDDLHRPMEATPDI